MKGIKNYILAGATFLLAVLIIFLPGKIMEWKDGDSMNQIHVEEVSPGRDALLVSMTLQERIGLYCSSGIHPFLLYGDLETSCTTSDSGEGEVVVDYSYKVEDQTVFEELEAELTKMEEDGILPEGILEQKKVAYEDGIRFYLYSKEEAQGAVFLCLQQYNKEGVQARFVVDEESGKIIVAYLFGQNMRKKISGLDEYAERYMAYIDVEYKIQDGTSTEKIISTADGDFYYYMYLTDSELAVNPYK